MGKLWGLRPQTPLNIKKILYSPYCPRSANNRERREKGKNGGYSPPNPQPGTMSLDPISLAHRTPDTTEPGQLQRFKPSLLPAFREQQGGKGKRKEWRLFAPKPPARNNVPGPHQFGSPHTRHDGTWAVTKIQTLPAVRAPRTTGREGKKKSMGAIRPQPPLNTKRFKPFLLPRSANNRKGREKGSYGGFAPKPP